MDHLEHLNPAGVAPPRATYSHAVVARGRTVWLAGQVAVDPDGQTVGIGDAAHQMRQVMENVGNVLAAAGAGWAHVVRFVVYVVGRENIGPARATREKLWPELFPDGAYPTSTFVVVDRLAAEEFLVEVEATAVLP
jgi:enamine deaminase RidA (YjgF/YER057c/UK114 family)